MLGIFVSIVFIENRVVCFIDLFYNMDAIKEKLDKLKNEQEFLGLLNEIVKEEMGDNFHPFTFQQLCFYANTDKIPSEKRYHTFKIPKKKKGEYRIISSPVKQLKIIQFFIKIILENLYEPKDCVMGFVKKRNVVDNAKRHLNKYYVQNLDIKDFFPSITQDMILGCLICAPYQINYQVAFMIARLCCIRREDNSKVLPQGSPTSPILANMVFSELDARIMNLARQFDLDYTRYADDMTFSGQYNSFKDEGRFMKLLTSIIENNGFKLNPDKKRIQKHGSRQEVTGIIISSKTNVRRKYIKSIRTMLHNWETSGYTSANKRFVECYRKEGKKRYSVVPDMSNVIDGRLEYLKMVKGQGDITYLRLKDRFDRLVSLSESKVIMSWSWRDFEKENGTNLEIKVSPVSKEKYVVIHKDNISYRYFLPHSLDVSNLDNLQINLVQRGEEKFYTISEIENGNSLLNLLGIK